MFLLVFLQTVALATGMISSQYPILYSTDASIASDVKEYYPVVGIVTRKDTMRSTVGKYFRVRDGEYDQHHTGIKGNLCNPDLSNTPAYWVAGTGSIIGSNIFLTAYHVVQSLIDDEDPYQNQALVREHVRLIFNYKQKVTGAVENKLYYYDIKSIVGYSRERDSDWIVLQTTKGFTHNQGKRYTLATNVQTGQRVYVLGYPLGQPLRYTEGVVTDVDRNVNKGLSIYSSGFAGSSGSPVVRVSDNEVLGLFTRYNDNWGQNDFSKRANETCFITTVLNPPNYVNITGPLSENIQRYFARTQKEL